MISIADIDQERSGILNNVLFMVMRSDTAKDVLAQVIDGLPTNATYELTITHRFDLLSRSEPSQQARILSQQFCDSPEMFDKLNLNSKVVMSVAILRARLTHFRLLNYIKIPNCFLQHSTCISWNWLRWRYMTWQGICMLHSTVRASPAAQKLPHNPFSQWISYPCPQCATLPLAVTRVVFRMWSAIGQKHTYLEVL
jgi:hypothetical protein